MFNVEPRLQWYTAVLKRLRPTTPRLKGFFMGRLFAVVSGKGGVGKSSISVLLADELAASGSVLVIDMDAGLRCLDMMFGVSERLVFDLDDLLSGVKNLSEVALMCRGGIALLPAPEHPIEPEKLHEFLLFITERYDFVIVDFPAGRNDGYLLKMPKFCEFLVVCQANPVSLRDAEIIADDITAGDFLEPRLIINCFDYRAFKGGAGGKKYTIDDGIDACGTRLVGVVPYDGSAAAMMGGRQLGPKNRVRKSMGRIASRLLFKNVPLYNLKRL